MKSSVDQHKTDFKIQVIKAENLLDLNNNPIFFLSPKIEVHFPTENLIKLLLIPTILGIISYFRQGRVGWKVFGFLQELFYFYFINIDYSNFQEDLFMLGDF